MDRVTVITVCYNAEATIEKTMRSICELDYLNIEYLIIDGESEDKTIKIVEKIKDEYADKDSLRIITQSEKDSGIYDAMNKGITLATGEWIIFMNAGDSFHSTTIVSKIFNNFLDKDIVGIYGDTKRFSGNWEKIVKSKPLEGIALSIPLPFCHQSVFVRSRILKQFYFDTSYKQAADYNFFVQCYQKKYNFIYIDEIISNYAMGGISETNTLFHLKEKLEIREKNGLEDYHPVRKQLIIFKLQFRQILKKILPAWIVKKIRGY